MTLLQEIKTKISNDAKLSASIQDFNYPSDVWNNTEVAKREHIAGYELGATEWTGKAQPVVDALQELVNLKQIKEQFGKTDEYLNNQPLAWEAAETALAKYKEVGNG